MTRWLCVVALALAGCGASDKSGIPAAGLIERLSLRSEAVGTETPETRVVQQLTPPLGVAPWLAEAREEPTTKLLASGEQALCFDSWGRKRVTIPGRYPSDNFNQVALKGVFPGVFAVQLTFMDSAGSVFLSPSMATLNTQAVQTVLFDMPRMQRENRTWDRLQLTANKGFNLFELHSVDLLHRPLGLALPRPGSDGRLITLDHSRRGFGVTTGEPVTCSIEAEAGSVLRFAYGLPTELNARSRVAFLKVAFTSKDGAVVRRARFRLDPTESSAWRELNFPLSEFDGEIEVRFELVRADGGEAVCALSELVVLRVQPHAPTILLVTSDTHRADHLGAVDGGIEIETPALDQLAGRGVLFEDCYSSTNVTVPSHVALMTGIHPRDTHVLANSSHLSEQAETLAERFRAAGYLTLAVVSVSQLGPRGADLGQGFDRMQSPNEGIWDAEISVQHVTEWLADNQGVPVFLWLHLFDAHHPYGPPEPFDRYYYPKDKDPFDASLPRVEIDPECIPPELLAVSDLEFPKAQYRAEISYLDRELGKLLDHPRLRKGILAVTADHGEILEKAGSYFNHSSLYPDTLHIPLILAWPGSPAGLRVERAVEQLDLGRTLLDLAGLTRASFPGTSLIADLEDSGVGQDRPRFAIAAHGLSASLTTAKWHYVLYLKLYKGRFRHVREEHSSDLHNLDTDPDCLVDVVDAEPERAARFRRMLVSWLAASSGDDLTTSGQQSAASMEQLAALGYATTVEASSEAWIDPECDCAYCAE